MMIIKAFKYGLSVAIGVLIYSWIVANYGSVDWERSIFVGIITFAGAFFFLKMKSK